MIQVVGRIPLFETTFLEHADVVADSEGFFLIVCHQNRTGATGFQNVPYLVAQLAPQLTVQVRERLIKQ